MKVLGMCTLLFCVMTGEAGATLIIVAVPAVVDRPRCSSNYNQLNAAFSLQLKSVVTQASLRPETSGPALNLLALDTSTEYCSVALMRDGELTYLETHAVQRHSELILPMIEQLLRAAGMAVGQLGGIAFGAGPGSFTGIRIACGVAQGLAFGAELPVVPVGTLAALAQEAGGTRVLACLDARMGEIYHASYRRDDDKGWTEMTCPAVGPASSAPVLEGDGWLGCGNGFAVYGDALAKRYGGQLVRVEAKLHPHARSIARLAMPVLAAGGGVPAEQALPLYVRDKVALKMHEQR
ncbi:MAG TPA: tRNA (adenosine(37)-N6)-threonylcarbamoyltransferase complex dimerization subunit type 1 TsaB [Burkholderiales bacterium]|nr:tRNA (adenosine(37)-N6)-threonylcarbamoyltransferase complex dimerization subunit type 1 TsaB [Burkholderiales bacterium]